MMLVPALENAARGFSLFRVRVGAKRPLRTGWQKEATRNPALLLRYFDDQKYNIGVYTSGLVVLDVDTYRGGAESLASLGELPVTYTVRTARGGLHLYFLPPPGMRFSTCTDVLPAMDVRAEGGLVVGAGSVFDGKRYTVEVDAPIATLPLAVAEKLKAHDNTPRYSGPELREDMRGAEALALRYLQTVADWGEDGSRNTTAFRVAARCIDFGCTWETAYGLMLEHWQCDPPMELEELEQVCRSAARNRKVAPGADNTWLGFEPVTSDAQAAVVFRDTQERIKRVLINDETIAALPPRKWIVARRLVRGKVSMLIADAGVGKTTLALQWACAVAEGGEAAKRLALDVRESVPVLVLNGEDELDELDRRFAAVSTHFKCDMKRLSSRLHYTSGSQTPWTFVIRGGQQNTLVETPEIDGLIKYIKKHEIGVLIVDPLVETHEADENKNPEMKRVMAAFRRIAEQADCAVLVVHHSRKPSTASSEGNAGNLSSARGASAMGGVARIVYTLYAMSDADGERFGIPQSERHKYVRLDDAKFNLGLASPRAQWFRRSGQMLPCGEEIGVLVPVDLADKTQENYGVLLDVLAREMRRGEELTQQEAGKRISNDPMAAGATAVQLGKKIAEAFGNLGNSYTAHGATLTFEVLPGSGGMVRCL